MQQGRMALEGNRSQEAFEIFKRVLTIDPEHVEAHYRLGEVLWRRRQIEQALKLMRRSVELAPGNHSIRLSLASYLEKAGKIDEAIREYRYIMEQAEGTPIGKEAEKRLILVLVKVYASKQRLDSALQLLYSLLEEYPGDPRVLQHLGFAYLIGGRYDKAVEIYKQVLARHPDDAAAHMNIAGVYETMKKTKKAADHFQRVIELDPQGPRTNEAKLRLALIRAFDYFKRRDFERALEQLRKALEVAPDHPQANSQMAVVYRAMGRIDEAETVLLEMLKKNPGNLDARLKLGTLYWEQQNPIDAIWHLEKVLESGQRTPFASRAAGFLREIVQRLGNQQVQALRQVAAQKHQFIEATEREPDNVEAHFNLGIILMRQGLTEKARRHFEEVVRRDPHIVRTYENLGKVYLQLGEPDKSIEAFSRYISLETDLTRVADLTVPYALALAQYAMRNGYNDVALRHFRRVLEKDGKNVIALYFTGILHAQQNEIEEAAGYYQKVLELAPGHFVARANLAAIYERQGDEETALTEYRYIARRAPDGPLKQNAERRIRDLKRRLNGLTNTASYAVVIDNNSNLSDANPSEEYYSTLALRFLYQYKYRKDLRLSVSWSPTYSTYHVGQFDFLNQAFDPTVSWGEGEKRYSLSYRFNRLTGVLNEAAVSVTQQLSWEHQHTLSLGKVRSTTLTLRDFSSETNPLFDSRTYVAQMALSRPLRWNWNGNFSISLTDNRNKAELGRDNAYFALGLTGRASKIISSRISLSGSAALNFQRYKHPDSIAVFASEEFAGRRRQTANLNVGVNFNYRFNRDLRAFVSANLVRNEANLPIFKCELPPDDPAVRCGDPGTIVPFDQGDLIGVPLQSASLGDFGKLLVNFGLAVNF